MSIVAEDFESVQRRKLRVLEAKHGVLGLEKMVRYLDGCLVFYQNNREVSVWAHFWWLVSEQFGLSAFDAHEVFLWWAHKGS